MSVLSEIVSRRIFTLEVVDLPDAVVPVAPGNEISGIGKFSYLAHARAGILKALGGSSEQLGTCRILRSVD